MRLVFGGCLAVSGVAHCSVMPLSVPQSLEVQIFRLFPECGVNLDLHMSLRWAGEDGQRISMWGPYQIEKELFDRALGKVAHLQSGPVTYKAVDALRHTDWVCNCIHAVSDIAGAEVLVTGTAFGEAASALVVRHLQPWIVGPGETHNWVSDGVGLKNHSIRFQK